MKLVVFRLILIFPGENRRPARRGAPPWQPHMPGYLPGEEDRQRLNVAKNEIDDLKLILKAKVSKLDQI